MDASNVVDSSKAAAHHALDTSKKALSSRAYIYPPLGALYLINHPSLWPPLFSRLLPCLALSVAVIIPMFLLTYVPQAAVLTLMNGPLGPINAVALVLSESSVIITTVARAFLLEKALCDIFDATLISEGQQTLVEKGREVKPGSRHDGAKKLGKIFTQPLHKFSPAYITQYLMLLPLNLIPFVGTAIFLVIQGRKIGPSYHARYFQLKSLSGSAKDEFIASNKGGYIAFGTTTMVMSLIPFASIVFTFTSTVAAALWAAELEKGVSYPGERVDVSGSEGKRDKKDL